MDFNIGPTRNPKCGSRRSWACDPINTTGDTLVRTRKCCSKRESSLVVYIADNSWMILSLLALPTQRQCTKNQVSYAMYV